MTVQWSKPARSHLTHLVQHLLEQSPMGAARTANRIVDVVVSLERFPYAGRLGRVAGTREIAVQATNYVIAYRVEKDRIIIILAVLHGAQRWPASFTK